MNAVSPIDEANPDEAVLAHLWRVNTWGAAQLVRPAAAHLPSGGRIINIGSAANIRTPFVGLSDYAASKGALAAYTRGWARDLAPRNIIQPGIIETEMLPTDDATVATLLQPIALGRFGTVSEVGQVVAFLASKAASYIIGSTLMVDGGWSI